MPYWLLRQCGQTHESPLVCNARCQFADGCNASSLLAAMPARCRLQCLLVAGCKGLGVARLLRPWNAAALQCATACRCPKPCRCPRLPDSAAAESEEPRAAGWLSGGRARPGADAQAVLLCRRTRTNSLVCVIILECYVLHGQACACELCSQQNLHSDNVLPIVSLLTQTVFTPTDCLHTKEQGTADHVVLLKPPASQQ